MEPVPSDRLLLADREARLDRHCDLVTEALLHGPEGTKDIAFVCSDEVQVGAHRFVLGTQCRYFRGILYKDGIMKVADNSVWGKKYRFWESSKCLKMLLQFLYTGRIKELEGSESIEENLSLIEPLLVMAVSPTKFGLGGVDEYIIRKLSRFPPRTFDRGMERLNLGMKANSQAIVDSVIAALPRLHFTDQSFKVKDLLPECVELVLRDVPLDATELVVAKAVKNWAVEYFGDVEQSDDEVEASQSTGAREQLQYVPESIRSLISLESISIHDLRRAVHRLRIFPKNVLLIAIRTLQANGLAQASTRVNPHRGREAASAGQTRIEQLPYRSQNGQQQAAPHHDRIVQSMDGSPHAMHGGRAPSGGEVPFPPQQRMQSYGPPNPVYNPHSHSQSRGSQGGY